ncbi:Uma2 family endonuclease [Nodosilinea sp. LEGE 07088]|uniref:Uma2 family endonuclease n=1 Tax=Nodosilinea sp. LEGE 07088 TaxID=2777968 RepID=UPI00187E1C11|nr:Uma2 family endonuclease [Nodosilinea sp. LEGE 07088]MBE9141472.1 Uma2 family endonuclease [Nodosilinea sp. LEGE 07088]
MVTSNTDVRWTVADLEVLPEDGRRYEIIDGELFVTRAPHWKHQNVAVKIATALENWSTDSGLGESAINPGLVFSEIDSVIPDVVWASYERLETMLDEAGHLIAAPELVVEVLSPGEKNERRDKESKLKIYSAYGVLEYWIADRQQRKLEVYRRDGGLLKLAISLYAADDLTSPVLPGFRVAVGRLF